MKALTKRTKENIASFKDVITKKVLKDCKKHVKLQSFDQDSVQVMLENVGLNIYEISLLNSQDYRMMMKLIETLNEKEIMPTELIKAINIDDIDDNMTDYN